MNKVLIVTGAKQITGFFTKPEFRDYRIVETLTNMDDALKYLHGTEEKPDIMLVVDGTPSSSGISATDMILAVHREFPTIRPVYITGEVSPADTQKCAALGSLVRAGVYDLLMGSRLTGERILNALNVLGKYEDVKYLLNYTTAKESESAMAGNGYRNVIACYSIKPGSGKSMLAINLAVGIARFGQKKKTGQPPRVAIIDGDLTGLSVGSLLHAENPQFNLREALKQAGSVIDADGNLIGTPEELEIVKSNIRRCFVHYPKVQNLYALVSSNISFDDLENVNPYQFYYLIQCVYSAFDVVVIDMNSSLDHRTTGPIFELASHIYCLIDPDYNNIKNNLRYQKQIEELGIADKIQYVLNKDIPEEKLFAYTQDLDYAISEFDNIGLDITNKIPIADTSVISNRNFRGIPLVLDTSPATREIKRALLRICNENWKIDYDAVREADNPNGRKKEPKKDAKKPEKGGLFGGLIDKINS